MIHCNGFGTGAGCYGLRKLPPIQMSLGGHPPAGRPIAGISIDPLIALPVGGAVSILITGHAKNTVAGQDLGLPPRRYAAAHDRLRVGACRVFRRGSSAVKRIYADKRSERAYALVASFSSPGLS